MKFIISKYLIWSIYVFLFILAVVTMYLALYGVYIFINSYFYDVPLDLNRLVNIGQFLTSALVAIFIIHTFIAQKKQSFENGFFELLKLHKEIVMTVDVSDAFDSTGNSELYKRQKAFKTIFNVLKQSMGGKDWKSSITFIKNAYSDFNKSNNEFLTNISNYYNSIHCILEYLDSWVILTNREKDFYLKILKVNLSEYELLHIYCYSLSNKKIKVLSDRYLLEQTKEYLLREGFYYSE